MVKKQKQDSINYRKLKHRSIILLAHKILVKQGENEQQKEKWATLHTNCKREYPPRKMIFFQHPLSHYSNMHKKDNG